MDGQLSEKLKSHNEQQRKELEEHLNNEFRNLRQNLSNRLNRFENEIENDIQSHENRIKSSLSSWSQLLTSGLLKYSLAVICGAVITISILASIPWLTEWWTSPAWHDEVVVTQSKSGNWITFKPGSIKNTSKNEDGFHVQIRNPRGD